MQNGVYFLLQAVHWFSQHFTHTKDGYQQWNGHLAMSINWPRVHMTTLLEYGTLEGIVTIYSS